MMMMKAMKLIACYVLMLSGSALGDIIKTIAGTGASGSSGDNGDATSATLYLPSHLALDAAGNIYIADSYNSRVRKITKSTGIITNIAGTGGYSFSGNGGAATSAVLQIPIGVAVDSTGTYVYIADTFNHCVRLVSYATYSVGYISTFAGICTTTGSSGDGADATSATLNQPYQVALDSSGNLYIADYNNNRIRKVVVTSGAPGVITTIAGTGTASFSGDGGAATSATLYHPKGLTLDSADNVYIADAGNQRIRKITASNGIISTIAGSSTSGSFSGDGGDATAAELNNPYGIAVDSSGNVYFADGSNECIRKVTISTAKISSFAGSSAGSGYTGDGGDATSATLNCPWGVVIDAADNMYVTDQNNHAIRQIVAPTVSPTYEPTASTSTDSSDPNLKLLALLVLLLIVPTSFAAVSFIKSKYYKNVQQEPESFKNVTVDAGGTSIEMMTTTESAAVTSANV